MKTLLLLLFSCWSFTILFCQKTIWAGASAATNYDHVLLDDPGGILSDQPFVTGQFGVNIEKDLNEMLTLGAGVNYKFYRIGARFPILSFYNDLRGFQFPLYLKLGKDFQGGLVRLNLLGGGSYAVIMDNIDQYYFGPFFPGFVFFPGSVTVNDFQVMGNDNERKFLLLQTGGGVSFRLFKKIKLELNIVRHFGFEERAVAFVKYSPDGLENISAKVSSKGGYTAAALQLFYPLHRSRE